MTKGGEKRSKEREQVDATNNRMTNCTKPRIKRNLLDSKAAPLTLHKLTCNFVNFLYAMTIILSIMEEGVGMFVNNISALLCLLS